jgi:hypothetical protein
MTFYDRFCTPYLQRRDTHYVNLLVITLNIPKQSKSSQKEDFF